MTVKQPCNICGSDRSRVLFKVKDLNYKTTEEEFSLEQCENCGLVYLDPQPGDIGMYYPGESEYVPHKKIRVANKIKGLTLKALQIHYNYPADRPFSLMDRLQAIFKILEFRNKDKYFFMTFPFGSDKRVLDIGCGNGGDLMSLKMLGWDARTQLYGVDYPNESLRYLKESEGINIVEGDFLNADLPRAFFDVVRMKHVLEHFQDPSAVMAKVSQILKPQGTVLMEIPNFRSAEALLLFRDKWYHIDAPRHLYHFSPRTLGRLMDKSGFDVQKIRLKKSSFPFIRSLEHFGFRVPKSVEKYGIRNLLKLFKLFGFSGELQCSAIKR